MALDPPPNGLMERLYEELEMDEQYIQDSVVKLRQWLNMQPHLPHDMEHERLKRMYLQCKGRMEIVKSVINMYYTVRGMIPEVMSNRDPFQSWFKSITDEVFFVTLPKLTDDYCRVSICGPVKDPPDINKFNLFEVLKMVFMVIDLRYREDLMAADIILVDVQRGTPAHAAKFTLPFFKKLQIIALQAYKARVQQVHLLNATPFMNSVLTMGKALVKAKHRDRLIIHRDGYIKGYDSLHEYVSPKVLPKEYGGEAGSIHDLWDAWKKKILNNREWFIKQGAQTADESKRPGRAIDTGELFGFEGSFRQLTVD